MAAVLDGIVIRYEVGIKELELLGARLDPRFPFPYTFLLSEMASFLTPRSFPAEKYRAPKGGRPCSGPARTR